MPRAKKTPTQATTSEANPSLPKTKTAFVRSLPELSARELVEKAKALGIQLKLETVSQLRLRDRAQGKAPAVAPAARAAAPAAAPAAPRKRGRPRKVLAANVPSGKVASGKVASSKAASGKVASSKAASGKVASSKAASGNAASGNAASGRVGSSRGPYRKAAAAKAVRAASAAPKAPRAAITAPAPTASGARNLVREQFAALMLEIGLTRADDLLRTFNAQMKSWADSASR